ncbi:MAG: arsenic efflux protein [Clostridia bacterium]|nr:arsenic efflux protein [Clostridia bacterium]
MHFLESLWHTLIETLPLIPFLYLTYLAMEALERYAGDRAQHIIRRAGHAGPALGAALGVIPQCGFSASGASLFAARVITPGTLIALFLSTSDEMLPVMLSSAVPPARIAKLLATKLLVAVAVGFALDAILLLVRHRAHHGAPHDHDHCHSDDMQPQELCRSGHCHCDELPVWRSALRHTISTTLVIYVVSLVLHELMHHGGEALIAYAAALPPLASCLVTSLIGLIPSCASSVALTELHLSGGLSVGALMAGLLTGAGAGTIVLARTNHPIKQTLLLLALLIAVGVTAGVLIDVTPLASWLS